MVTDRSNTIMQVPFPFYFLEAEFLFIKYIIRFMIWFFPDQSLDVLKSVFVIYSDTTAFSDMLRRYSINVDFGESRNKYNYLLIPRRNEINLCEQLEEIINDCQEANNIRIILCNMKENYEGILYSKNISKGRNFDKFINEILNYEDKKQFINGYYEFIAYYPKSEQLPETTSNNYHFHLSSTVELSNGYIMKRFSGTRNRSINLEQKNLYVERVDEMKIESVTNSKIIENNGTYIEKNLVIHENEFDADLSKDILQLLQELENLKSKLAEDKAEVVQQTADAVKQNDESKIKAGLRQIASFGKDVLSSVVATTITTYMTKYGILPPV